MHAWSLPRDIDDPVWTVLHQRAVDVLAAASRKLDERLARTSMLPVLRGPDGSGPPVIEPTRIIFNGNGDRGEKADPFRLERNPTVGLIGMPTLMGRPEMMRRAFCRCNTRGQPYELAVNALLLVAAHALGEEMRLGTEDPLRAGAWLEAATLVKSVLCTPDRLVQDDRGFIKWVPMPSGPSTLRAVSGV